MHTLDVSVIQEVKLSPNGRNVYRALGHERRYAIKQPGVLESILDTLDQLPDTRELAETAWELGLGCLQEAFESPQAMWESVAETAVGAVLGEFRNSEHSCSVLGEIASGWAVFGDGRAVLYCAYFATSSNECSFFETTLNVVAFVPLVGDLAKTSDQLRDLKTTARKLDVAAEANLDLRQLGLDELIARTSKANPQLQKQWDDLLDRASSTLATRRTGAVREIMSAKLLDQQGYKLLALGKHYGRPEFDKIVEAPDGKRFFVEDRDFHNVDLDSASSKLDHAEAASKSRDFVDEFEVVDGYILMIHKSNAKMYENYSLARLVEEAQDKGDLFLGVGRNLYRDFDVKYGIMIDNYWSPPQ